jgi:hypothetical protein
MRNRIWRHATTDDLFAELFAWSTINYAGNRRIVKGLA